MPKCATISDVNFEHQLLLKLNNNFRRQLYLPACDIERLVAEERFIDVSVSHQLMY